MALIEQSPLQTLWAGLRQLLTPRPPPVLPAIPTAERDVVWRQESPEPGVWAEVLRRPDGLYSFAEWKREWVTAPKAGTWETEFPVYESGLYESEDEARKAMPDHIDWIMR